MYLETNRGLFGCFAEEAELAGVVVWLEAVIIRFYSVEQRQSLQSNFAQRFGQYLADLRYPGPATDVLRAVDWLLTYAIDLEYQDRAEQLNATRVVTGTAPEAEPTPAAEAVAALLSSLGIASTHVAGVRTQDSDELSAACHIIQRRYAANALHDATQNSRGNRRTKDDKRENSIHGDIQTWMQTFPAGLMLMTPRLTRLAALLRLLYVTELHATQTVINDLICQLQQLTAAPQTDLSLAQVGR